MAKGYILLHRQIWENEIWQENDPFDKRAAWVDLLMMANHADNKSVKGMSVVDVKRGQVLTSYNHMANRWHWSKSKVFRYMKQLAKRDMIILRNVNGTESGTTNGTLITIVKYDVFQSWRNANGTESETETETKMKRERNENRNLTKKEKNEIKNEEINKRNNRQTADDINAIFEKMKREGKI